MAEYYIAPKSSFDATADAIREKTGSQATIEWTEDGFADAIEDISSGGYSLEEICTVGFPSVSGDIVFSGTTIRPAIFKGNTQITSFSGPNVTSVKGDPWGTGTTTWQFEGCTNLLSVSLPALTDMINSDRIFYNCTKLQTFIFNWKSCVGLGASIFQNDTLLNVPSVVMPLYDTNFWGSVFYGVAALQIVDAFKANHSSRKDIRNNAFQNTSLDTLVLRSSVYHNLSNINAFQGTPFASDGTGGTLYVQESLLSTYPTLTNWSTILGYANNQIKSIESTHTDPNAPIDLTLYYADGTLIE